MQGHEKHGFGRLYIAGESSVEIRKAEVTAIHASDLIHDAVFCSSVEQALEGTGFFCSRLKTTRQKTKIFQYTSRTAGR